LIRVVDFPDWKLQISLLSMYVMGVYPVARINYKNLTKNRKRVFHEVNFLYLKKIRRLFTQQCNSRSLSPALKRHVGREWHNYSRRKSARCVDFDRRKLLRGTRLIEDAVAPRFLRMSFSGKSRADCSQKISLADYSCPPVVPG
jgi:hypothetical protein